MTHPAAALPGVLLGLIAGSLTGAVYFLLLWWTVRRIPRVRRAGGLLVVGLLCRLAIALGAFALLVIHGGASELLGGVGGFLVARTWAVRRIGVSTPRRSPPPHGTDPLGEES